MIQSMTGYAALARETAQGSLFLELKSVNNRFFDLQFRVVEELRLLEPSLRELIAARIGRGKLDCRVSFTPTAAAGKQLSLNAELLQRLAEPCLALMREALAELCATRLREGGKLKDMILERVAKMQALVDRVTPQLPLPLAPYQEKLAARPRRDPVHQRSE